MSGLRRRHNFKKCNLDLCYVNIYQPRKFFAMAESGTISLHELVPSEAGQQDSQETRQSASILDQNDSRQWESKRKRACVLTGSAILQLPIWGKINP